MGCHVTFCDVKSHLGLKIPLFLRLVSNNGSKNPGISSQISEKVWELAPIPRLFFRVRDGKVASWFPTQLVDTDKK